MRAGRRAPLARNRPIFLSALLVFDFFYFLTFFYFLKVFYFFHHVFSFAADFFVCVCAGVIRV